MAYDPEILDWRSTLVPLGQQFRATAQAIAGGMTLGGFMTESPEPGGRGELLLGFPSFFEGAAALDASWTLSRMSAGVLFRIRLWPSVQLVPRSALMMLTEDSGAESDGVPWANDQPWASGENWRWDPVAPVAADAAMGAAGFTVDLSGIGEVLRIGHVIGLSEEGVDSCHMVTEVTYHDDLADLTVSPPLRRALTTDSVMRFRPSFVGAVRNAKDAASLPGSRAVVALGNLQLVEALL